MQCEPLRANGTKSWIDIDIQEHKQFTMVFLSHQKSRNKKNAVKISYSTVGPQFLQGHAV